MNTTPIVISIIFLGVITFIYRFSFVSSHGRKLAEKIPQNLLILLAPATFAAIIANNLVSHQSDPLDFKIKCLVAFLSLVVAYLTRSLIFTLLFGLIVLYLVQNHLSHLFNF